MEKLGVLIRLSDYLEWMYDNAEDDGERSAVSHIEDVVHNWYSTEVAKQFKEVK